MSKDATEKKNIVLKLVDEILILEKKYSKEINPVFQADMVKKISDKFEEVYSNVSKTNDD